MNIEKSKDALGKVVITDDKLVIIGQLTGWRWWLLSYDKLVIID